MSAGLLLVVTGRAGTVPDEPKQVLLHVQQTVVETIRRLPRYMCTQTIERSRFAPENSPYGPTLKNHLYSCDDIVAEVNGKNWKRRLASSDRVRLEVAVSHEVPGLESEMYSWPGAQSFSNRSVFEMVRDGAMSTGSFSSMLASVFGGDAARFTYRGERTARGIPFSEFGFRVPKENSKYTFIYGKGAAQELVMAYDGAVFIDPETSELARLVIRSGELPPETGVCELTQTLDYGRVRLRDEDFLLPTDAQTRVIHTDETEAVNRIHYSACREFRGESDIRYEQAPEEAPRAAVAAAAAIPLPSGLPFKVVFTEPIPTATAAAGDPIGGRLKTAIRDESQKVLVPEGTPVWGRIVRIRRFFSEASVAARRQPVRQEPSLVIDIRLETIEIGGRPQPIKAAVDAGDRRFVPTGQLTMRMDVGSVDAAADRSPDSDIAIFPFWDQNPHYVVKGNLESSWVTRAQ